jgi:hypothetical protein
MSPHSNPISRGFYRRLLDMCQCQSLPFLSFPVICLV